LGAHAGDDDLVGLQPARVGCVDRVVGDIGVEVEAVCEADGVGLQEAAEGGGIGAGLVVVEAYFTASPSHICPVNWKRPTLPEAGTP
jgi:hypothetical protein